MASRSQGVPYQTGIHDLAATYFFLPKEEKTPKQYGLTHCSFCVDTGDKLIVQCGAPAPPASQRPKHQPLEMPLTGVDVAMAIQSNYGDRDLN